MVSQTETVRGNERIQQLMEEFPEIPRSLVVKADALREGIKPSVASRQVGRWALPDAKWYFQYNKEDTHTAGDTAEGYTRSPLVCHLPDGVSFQSLFHSGSPYEFRYEERGRYRLYRDEEPIEEVFFPPRPQWYDRKTSSGKPMSSVIAMRGEHWLFISALLHCEFFNDNLGCKYCNIDPSESTKKGLGLERVTAKREQDIYETFVAAAQEGDIQRVGMSGGVILDPSKEADNYARIVRTLRRAIKDVGREASVSVKPRAMDAQNQMKMKEAGASSLGFNLEVWDPKLWEVICPGKAKYVGRERWLEYLLQAVEIWGVSNSSFVLGVEMAPPYGFKSEDEAAESVLQGWEWMMAHRVMPGATFWRPVPGTEFAGIAPPRIEYFLRLSLAHYKLAVEYNMAPKRSRLSGDAGLGIAPDFPHVDLRESPVAGPMRAASLSGDVC